MSSGSEEKFRMPSWAEPSETPKSRKHPEVRRRIVDAALELADREGYQAVSMRRVAAAVDMGTMSLYSYVADKSDLIVLMSDRIGEEILIDEVPSDWKQALRAIARQSRQVMLAHPWLLTVDVEPFLSPNFARHIDQSLAAIAPLELDTKTAMTILRTVDDFTAGCVRDETDHAEEGGMHFPVGLLEQIAERFDLPHLARAAPHMREIDSHFEDGLEMIIAGIEATVTAQRR